MALPQSAVAIAWRSSFAVWRSALPQTAVATVWQWRGWSYDGFPAFPALSAALTQRSTAGPKPRELAQAAVATRAQKCVLRNTVQPAATA